MRRVITTILLCLIAISTHAVAIQDGIDIHLRKVLSECFPNTPQSNFSSSILSGGYSNAENYKIDCIDCGHREYVVRILPSNQSLLDVKREYWAYEQAATLGVAPHVYAVLIPHRAILVNFQKGKTLSVNQGAQKETIHSLGIAIRTVHKIPKNPYENISIVEKYARKAQSIMFREEVSEAMCAIHMSQRELSKMPINSVTLHGDLNLRNIFLNGDGSIKFVDWTDTTWDDAFFDLSYFAISQSYDRSKTHDLLRSYLGCEPSEMDLKRYHLTEMINLAGISIGLNELAHKISKMRGEALNDQSQIEELPFYANKFAEGGDLTAQFLYDCSRALLRQVREQGKREKGETQKSVGTHTEKISFCGLRISAFFPFNQVQCLCRLQCSPTFQFALNRDDDES